MKNSWRVILTFSQNSLGKQFRNDLMMLRGYCTPSKTNKQTPQQTNKQKQKQKQNKTKTKTTKQNKNNKTKQNKQKKNMFCALSQNYYQRLFDMRLTVNCPSKELKDSIKI